ncbi:MAG: SpvB/TcaC N-terminal domain-containing protein, partial [Myxococcota bacterium]
SLAYDSGAGNGPFGLGWRLSAPSVRRKTDKGLPRYRDTGDEADTFVLSDAEDLVPMRVESSDGWSEVVRSVTVGSDTYEVQRYRPRVEGGFALIERWRRVTDGRAHWRTLSPDNVRRTYGKGDQARVTDPDDPRRVFEWLLEEEVDERGNVIAWQYAAEDRVNVASHPAERRKGTPGSGVVYRYPKRVSWANTVPDQNPDAGGAGAFRLHLVFDYGEHDADDPELRGFEKHRGPSDGKERQVGLLLRSSDVRPPQHGPIGSEYEGPRDIGIRRGQWRARGSDQALCRGIGWAGGLQERDPIWDHRLQDGSSRRCWRH